MRRVFIDDATRGTRVALVLALLLGSSVLSARQQAAPPHCQSSGPLVRIPTFRKRAESPSAAVHPGGCGRTMTPARLCSWLSMREDW